jgi:small nuclear ribonucleoprotein (snRNP)-like protein
MSPNMTESPHLLDQLIGREVVLDVASLYVYLGTLVGRDQHFLILEEADVHDLRDTSTSRELYVLEARRLGIRSNRVRVLVRTDEVVSVSALNDVIP